jgi:hypothetical protein
MSSTNQEKKPSKSRSKAKSKSSSTSESSFWTSGAIRRILLGFGATAVAIIVLVILAGIFGGGDAENTFEKSDGKELPFISQANLDVIGGIDGIGEVPDARPWRIVRQRRMQKKRDMFAGTDREGFVIAYQHPTIGSATFFQYGRETPVPGNLDDPDILEELDYVEKSFRELINQKFRGKIVDVNTELVTLGDSKQQAYRRKMNWKRAGGDATCELYLWTCRNRYLLMAYNSKTNLSIEEPFELFELLTKFGNASDATSVDK